VGISETAKTGESPRHYPQNNAAGSFYPRQFGEGSWARFARHRRARYRLRIGSEPTDLQDQLIRHLIVTEWSALESEHYRKMREARIARTAFRQALLRAIAR